MTIAELKRKLTTFNTNGRAPIMDLLAFGDYLEDSFAWVCDLCEPLNLVISYRDQNIYKQIDQDWWLRKPLILTADEAYVDIDERLDTAFALIMISKMMHDDQWKRDYEDRAYRQVLDYGVNIMRIGDLAEAKRLYEENSPLISVRFDCIGKYYQVNAKFVELVVSCLLCGETCTDANDFKQLQLYKKWLINTHNPRDRERLLAVDHAVAEFIIKTPSVFSLTTTEKICQISKTFSDMSRLYDGEVVNSETVVFDQRLGRGKYGMR